MKYILIDIKESKPEENLIIKQPERVLWDDKKENEIKFICEMCFKELESRNLIHLSKCQRGYPFEGLCKSSCYPSFMLFKLDKEKDIMQKILNAIVRLSEFSKLEQGIGTNIPTRKILGKIHFSKYGYNKFYCYVLFDYKNIVAYCLIQNYKSLFGEDKIVIRDIYALPHYRRRGYSSRILFEIARENNQRISDLFFSMPVSDRLKRLLKKNGLNDFKGIYAENFKSVTMFSL